MKKFISILLALTIVLSACSVAFAAAGECDCGNSPVIYVRGFGEPIYENTESGDRVEIFGAMGEVAKVKIPQIIFAVFGLLTGNNNMFAKFAIDVADAMFEKFECDENGTPIYNTSINEPTAPTYQRHLNELCHLSGDVDGYTDNCYYFSYDWRMSPLDNAKLLNDYVLEVMEATRHSKITFACHSQGNTIVASYLYLYGSENIDKIAFLSPAYQGLSLVSALFTGNIEVSGKADALETFIGTMPMEGVDWLPTLISVLKKIKVIDGLLWWLDGVLDDQYKRVYDEYLGATFGNFAGLWAFVSVDDFEEAKKMRFGENYEETEFIKKIDEYNYNVQKNLTKLIGDAMDNGTDVMICAGYGISSIPVTADPEGHSDMLIDSEKMSLGATFAPVGKTFENGYVQAVDCGHNHISPDRMVDASTCAFPENTWFFKGMDHNTFPDEYIFFINEFFESDGEFTVNTYEKYPQFLRPEGSKIVPV